MSYEPRTIAFMAELLHPPAPLKAQTVQEVHNALFHHPEISYQNFQVGPDGIHLSNPPQTPGSVSAVSFGPDRLVLREELRGTTVEDFATRLVNVATLAFRTLGQQTSLAQQIVVRSLINPQHCTDSREFLARRVVSADEEAWSAFGRPMLRLGFSFTFPQGETHDDIFNLRIETWTQDPRSLWIENVGSYTKPLPVERMPDLSNLLLATYRFATRRATAFVAHFDRP